MIAVNVSVRTELTRRAADNVLSRSTSPTPKVNRLPSPPSLASRHGLRAHVPPPLDQSAARVTRVVRESRLSPLGRTCWSSSCETTESLPRQTSRRIDVFTLSSVESCVVTSLSSLSLYPRCFFARRPFSNYTRTIYIAPKRTSSPPGRENAEPNHRSRLVAPASNHLARAPRTAHVTSSRGKSCVLREVVIGRNRR